MAGSMLGGGNRRGGRGRHRPMHDINVTPFVDVMLVLLIVFMVTAPLMTQGVQISLPEVENAPITEEKEPIQVSIKSNGDTYIQTQKVSRDDLIKRLSAIRKVRADASILLRADKATSYGQVMEVMSSLQTAGLVDVGLITQPSKSGK